MINKNMNNSIRLFLHDESEIKSVECKIFCNLFINILSRFVNFSKHVDVYTFNIRGNILYVVYTKRQ
jgi:hypothetical protein